MSVTGFLQDFSLWPLTAPTWNDTAAGAPGGIPLVMDIFLSFVEKEKKQEEEED